MTAVAVVALLWLTATLGARPTAAPLMEAARHSHPDSSLRVSLLTCAPGKEIFELYGHTAIRVKGNGIDSVWNYGLFDFHRPNFIYRFVKGETDYMVGAYPFAWFVPEYEHAGRRVWEQELNLTPAEASALHAMLQREIKPDLREYRYNYVKDNCATRFIDRLDSAAQARPVFSDSITYGTFRNEMRAYNRNYPWYQFGIDLALGSGIDYPLTGREEMFVPMELMQKVATAHFADGRPMVKATRVLGEGRGDQQLPPTPWWCSPMAVMIILFAAAAILCLYEARSRRIVRWANSLFFILAGLTGCVSVFLVFVSSHEATSPNMLTLWLNPLQLLLGICLWWRHTRFCAMAVAWYNIAVIIALLLIWPMQSQSANPAIFPLLGAALLLSATYAIIAPKESYKNRHEPNSHNSARKPGGIPHRAQRRSSAAKARGGNRR